MKLNEFVTPYPTHTDPMLVTLLQEGDKKAFEEIYRRHAGELFGYLRKNISRREDCEELLQDLFEALWVRHDSAQIESLRHYLFRSVRYMVIRYFYQRGVKKRYAEHYAYFAELYETMDVEGENTAELQPLLLSRLEGLPERCKEAMRLRIVENQSNGEVARRMGISKKTVGLYMSKALGHLRAGDLRFKIS